MIGPKKLSELTPGELKALLERGVDLESVEDVVKRIVEDVRANGDEAVLRYTERFDGVRLTAEELAVSRSEIEAAYREVPPLVVRSMEMARKAIEKFHSEQLPPDTILVETYPGCLVALIRRPVRSVGVYVPGGKHAYPSTALMTVVPAKVAGVRRVVACTPPRRDGRVNPATLVALDLAGADEVFRIGGAQAVAAMVYGTETVPKVDKIVGPGNAYVTVAKKLVAGVVGIDMLAGPSEIMVLADRSASPSYVAWDMVAQLEHDLRASAVLISLSEELAWDVLRHLTSTSVDYEGRRIAILLADSMEEALNFVNEYAPEHLELLVKDPFSVIHGLENVGSISIGETTPVALSDYVIGANHVLPTSGTARYRGALTVYDYLKFIPLQYVAINRYSELAQAAALLAKVEDMALHAKSILIRVRMP